MSKDLEVGLFDWTVVMETQGLDDLQKEQRPFYSDSHHFDPGKGCDYESKCPGKPLEGFKRGGGGCAVIFNEPPGLAGQRGLKKKPSLLLFDTARRGRSRGRLDQGPIRGGGQSWADLKYKLTGF